MQGITEVIPSNSAQQIVQRAIFEELIPSGKASPNTIQYILLIIGDFKAQGCDGVILACTELPLIINNENSPLPVLDSNLALAEAAVQQALLLQEPKKKMTPKL